MFPKSFSPVSLFDGLFIKQLQSRLFGFPKLFDGLYRSILDNAIKQNTKQPERYLGVITDKHPTIFSLLKEHPDYGKSPSAVLDAAPNKCKTFTRIPTGAYIYLNPETNEISWSMTPPTNDILSKAKSPAAVPMDPLSHRLDKAVKSYVGKPYDEIDCYELLVKGITDIGFSYHGEGGIKDRLIQWAETAGKKKNTYLTGEGLVQAAGNIYYSRTLKPGSNRKALVEEIHEEIAPRLNKGHILSFSTRTRGHTGMISEKNGQWTFINSGDMDHNLNGKQRSMAVGEENLKAEIENWLRRASRKNETLQISLGRLDGRKLAEYLNPGVIIKKSV